MAPANFHSSAVKKVEKQLLQYFSQSVQHSPVIWGPPAELQRTVSRDSSRHVRAELFPSLFSCTAAPPGGGADCHVLSNRFSNLLESKKTFGLSEVPVGVVEKAIKRTWKECGTAWRELSCRSPVTVPDTVLFLVLHSFAKHALGGSRCYRFLADEVRRHIYDPQNHTRFSHILRVVVVTLGLSLHLPCMNCSDEVHLPRAGVYTLQAAVSSIATLPALSHGGPECTATLQPTIFLASDSFMIPRNCVNALRGRCRVDVLPGLMSSTLSESEQKAYSRFVACRCARHGRTTEGG